MSHSSDASISLPQAKRRISATMIGTLIPHETGRFEYRYGITSFPVLDNPVWFVLEDELDAIFDKTTTQPDTEKGWRGFYLPVGESTAYRGYKVKVNPDALFGKHLAVLGNTGSGKSCTIAALLQTLFRFSYHPGPDGQPVSVQNAHFVIFDTNGEYRKAFFPEKKPPIGNCLYIGSEDLKIPYWFLNREDFIGLFIPSEGVQQPVLTHALLFARNEIPPLASITPQTIAAALPRRRNHFISRRSKYPQEDEKKCFTEVLKHDGFLDNSVAP